ncbi:MAG: hypothetical protein IKC49_01560 [Clostridia bacterium]|nr:hypothetical protein [Clostridia bacterium]
MDALMACVSIIAIIAIVVVAGGLVAFIGHMIIGAFDNGRKDTVAPKEVLDYAQYKQLESAKAAEKENDIVNTIDSTKVQEEKALAEEDLKNDFNIDETVATEEEIQEIENSLKQEELKVEDDSDDDLDDLLSEISNEIIDEEKENIAEEEAPKMSEELAQYSIDDYLNGTDKKEDESVEDEEESDESIEEVIEEENTEVRAKDQEIKEEIVEDTVVETKVDEDIEDEEDLNEIEEDEVIEEVAKEDVIESKESHDEEIARLKAELADLNKKLADATNNKVEVVTINATEEECVARLAILEERLKNVKKDYKINMKEYRPLKKVMSDYERYQTKLRRKDAMVAKKKVALYGVNNYVDIDKEKAEKLSNELELLNGLRLSVSHCEEVINANKDRFPILEHTNKILEDQIVNIEADIAATQETLRKIREENGDNGENNNSGENNEE